jgi:hypothetical protein
MSFKQDAPVFSDSDSDNNIDSTMPLQSQQQTLVESNEIKPAWKQTDGKTNPYMKYVAAPVLCGSIISEILAKKLGYNFLRPSILIGRTTDAITTVFYNAGYVVAYISDIAFLFRRIAHLLADIFNPIISAVSDAVYDIFGGLVHMFVSSVKSFLRGYDFALDETYNQFITIITSLITVGGSLLVVLFGLEAYGIARKIKWIRPSYYLIKYLADPIYDIFRFISYLYSCLGKILSNFKFVLDAVVDQLMPVVKPIVKQLEIGAYFIKKAAINVGLEAPCAGITKGFNDAVTGLKKNVGLTAFIAAGTCVATIAFGLHYFDSSYSIF